MLDIAVVRYIARSNKKTIAAYLKSVYGGTLKGHYDWLDHVAKNYYPLYNKQKVWRSCTIARLDKDFGRREI